MKPIQLASPDGAVFAYACGSCLHVRAGGESFGPRDSKDLDYFAELSRQDADRCCRCRVCREPLPLSFCDVCHACKPAEDAKWEKLKATREAREEAREVAEAEALKRAKSESAALELRCLMQDISEDYYCASWLSQLEFSCWSFAHGGLRHFGLGEVSQAECDRLRELGEAAGGWWTWRDEAGGEVFVTTEEWLPIWEQHEAELKAWEESRPEAKAKTKRRRK